MKIRDKIEEIRQQPEHIRIRYVWLSVAMVMIFIIAIWIFSLKVEFNKERNNIEMPKTPAFPTLPSQENVPAEIPLSEEGFDSGLGDTIDSMTINEVFDNSQE